MVHFTFRFLKQNVRKLLFAFFLFSAGLVHAQAPVMGYDYLGACNGHNYYISTAPSFGININAVVGDFRTKTALPASQAYAAAIVNAAENACITALMVTYNGNKYGGVSLAAAQNWGDQRNAWIGFTDAAVEGNFVWSNGQPICKDFTNWNVGEPNNFAGSVSNGEDYTELLIMAAYDYNGVSNNPLGKWNDWFNQFQITSTGGNGAPTLLPVIIEVGTADACAPRGNVGCSHGYWKNAKDAAWTGAGYNRTQIFSNVFGVTNGRDVITIGSTTLQNALELGGGGYNNLARQGVAALLNAARGFYPYTVSEINAAVKNMFNTGSAMLPNVMVNGTSYAGGSFTDAGSLATYLDQLNNLGCPLNNKGETITMTATSSRSGVTSLDPQSLKKSFAIQVYPNPSRSGFSIQIDGLSTERANIKITDITGRIVEVRSNIAASQVLTIGNNYRAGMYNVEVMQGTNRKQLKLIKQ